MLIPIAFLLLIGANAGILVQDAEYWALYNIVFSIALILLPAITSPIIRLLDRR